MEEVYWILDELNVEECLNLIDNPEEIKQLLNKVGRPELFNECINELNNMEDIAEREEDPDYIYTSDSESECSEVDIVNENFDTTITQDGFYELIEVQKNNIP